MWLSSLGGAANEIPFRSRSRPDISACVHRVWVIRTLINEYTVMKICNGARRIAARDCNGPACPSRQPVGGHAPPPHGASRVPSISFSMHADAITPTEPLDAVAISSSGDGLPQNSGGSASATYLFGACSAFTHVSACMFARSPKVTFTQSTSTHLSPPASPWLLPAERPISRVGLAPTGER